MKSKQKLWTNAKEIKCHIIAHFVRTLRSAKYCSLLAMRCLRPGEVCTGSWLAQDRCVAPPAAAEKLGTPDNARTIFLEQRVNIAQFSLSSACSQLDCYTTGKGSKCAAFEQCGQDIP